MGFDIASHFDQRYSCPACDRDQLDPKTDFDERTWICEACHEPIRVAMTDRGGNSYLIERRIAQQVLAGDLLVYQRPGGRLEVGEVKSSQPGTGKHKRWFLAVERFGHVLIAPDSYLNII